MQPNPIEIVFWDPPEHSSCIVHHLIGFVRHVISSVSSLLSLFVGSGAGDFRYAQLLQTLSIHGDESLAVSDLQQYPLNDV